MYDWQERAPHGNIREKTSPDRGNNASVRGKGNGCDAEQSVQAREIPNETEILGLSIL